VYQRLLGQRLGYIPADVPQPSDDVNWGNDYTKCKAAAAPMSSNCPHTARWGYTVMDARMGQACQNPAPCNATDAAIKNAMLK
jgi:hypothetical protein